MKRFTFIILAVAVFAPLLMEAGAETMAERKKRIMRKYLRERQNVVDSNMVLPDIGEDERITDSEKLSQPQDVLKRERPTTPPTAQPMPVPAVQVKRNWLLDEETESDPYADPFAVESDPETEASTVDWYSEWRRRQEELAAEEQESAADSYQYLRDSRYTSDGQRNYNSIPQQNDEARPLYGSAPRTSYGQSQPNSGLNPSGTTRYGLSPSSGMLQWSSPAQETDDSPASPSGYTPYRRPYQTRPEQRRQQQQGYPQTQQQEDFSRPTPYQKWKNENKGWDPASDDAYLDELMQRNRR